jgi:hypothetical protein
MGAFHREAQLVEEFTRLFEEADSPFESSGFLLEFDYQSGRSDVILKTDDDQIFAFEAKLSNWRVALHQAYRNSHFAHYCYVVLPRRSGERAFACAEEFRRRGVGLCVVDEGIISVLLRASPNTPLLPWLTQEALNSIPS